MVETVTLMEDNNRIKHMPQMIVELVGPAGAGKTTLSRVLRQRDEKILIGPDIELRKARHIPVFVRNIPFSMPIFLHQCRPSRRFTWEELKYIAYLNGWPHLLKQTAPGQGEVILLDHGPVFRLATLFEFGPENLKCECFEPWWNRSYEQWAFTLDMIVWLDTSDAILTDRINARNQRHAMKGKLSLEAQQFLARYRLSYAHILTKLKTYKDLTILQFDTDKKSVGQITDEILTVCRSKFNAN
jgi:thymidylate kinase